MHTLRLKLITTESDRAELEKRFAAMCKCHNVLVKRAVKLLNRLDHDKEYQKMKTEYVRLLKKEKLSEQETVRKEELSGQMMEFRLSIGLGEHELQDYIKPWVKRNGQCLQSQPVQKEASRVWSGVKKVLFGNGKKLHFKKNRDFSTIGGKSSKNGVRFDRQEMKVTYNGLVMPVKLPRRPKDRDYVMKSLESKIKYCELKRLMFPNGWHYYVIIVMDDEAPKKACHPDADKGSAGLDIGTSTAAVVTDHQVILEELAPEVKTYNRKIARLQKSMDRSKRDMNPEKFNPDGTINQANKDRWIWSASCLKKRNRMKSLYRKKAAYIKESHEKLCNILIQDNHVFYVEQMSFAGLARRAKQTKKPNGKKKRFGRSMNNRAPASFVSILERKCRQHGGKLVRVKTKQFKASQFHHDTGEYVKDPLSKRNKTIENHVVQRDLYSAFLLKNSNKAGTKPDIQKCRRTFSSFIDMHDYAIETMKQNHISKKSCFGF